MMSVNVSAVFYVLLALCYIVFGFPPDGDTQSPTVGYIERLRKQRSQQGAVPSWAPREFTVRHVDNRPSWARLSWLAPRQTNGRIISYVILYSDGQQTTEWTAVNGDANTLTVHNLTPQTTYYFKIRANNLVGQGPLSPTVIFTTLAAAEPATPMMPPIGVRAVVLSSNSVLLTWTDPSLGNQQRVTDGRYYTVRYSPRLVREQQLKNVTQLNILLDDLRPHTEYEFTVKVVKGRRQSTWSLSVFNRTNQAVPSSAPRELTVLPVDNRPSWARLGWLAPRQTNGEITSYVILFSDNLEQPEREWTLMAVNGNRTTATVHDLTPQTTYFFKIRAHNLAGQGPLSPPVLFMTLAASEQPDCMDPDLPTGTWLLRRRDRAMVRCNHTQQTWYLTCRDGGWVGSIGNCTQRDDTESTEWTGPVTDETPSTVTLPVSSANTEDACKAACEERASCTGVLWYPASPPGCEGHQCLVVYPQPTPGVRYYKIRRRQ